MADKPYTYDAAKFDKIKKKSLYVRGLYTKRNEIMNKMEDYFMMIWKEHLPKDPNMIRMVDPTPRSKVQGGHRLLKAAEPKVEVPFEKNNKKAKEKSSKLEKAASAMFYANSRQFDIPLHEEVVKSALLFGEIQAGITLTEDLEEATNEHRESYAARIKEIKKRTPIILDLYDPRTGYPVLDRMGMAGYHRAVTMTKWEIEDTWGDAAARVFGTKQTKKPTTRKTEYHEEETLYIFCEYWDWVDHCAWIEEHPEQPLMLEAHNMEEIPIVYRSANGSNLHDLAKKCQPFLYGVYKSNLYEALNMAYTMLFDHTFTIGATGNLVYESKVGPGGQPKQLNVQWDQKGGYYNIEVGEAVKEAPKPQLDPSVMQAIQIGDSLITKATIFDQALGEPLGSNAPYSMVALLNHAGRLPLIDAQRASSWAFGDMVEKSFRILKKYGKGKAKIQDRTGYVELETSDIPEDFIVEVNVKIDLPQDIKQNAIVAAQLLEKKITSKEWVRNKLMQIEQSDEMDKEILIEDLVDLFAQLQVQQVMAAAQQAANPNPEGPPPAGPGGIDPSQLSPEMMQEIMSRAGINPDTQGQVQRKMGMGQGASSGNPMTEEKQIPGEPPIDMEGPNPSTGGIPGDM